MVCCHDGMLPQWYVVMLVCCHASIIRWVILRFMNSNRRTLTSLAQNISIGQSTTGRKKSVAARSGSNNWMLLTPSNITIVYTLWHHHCLHPQTSPLFTPSNITIVDTLKHHHCLHSQTSPLFTPSNITIVYTIKHQHCLHPQTSPLFTPSNITIVYTLKHHHCLHPQTSPLFTPSDITLVNTLKHHHCLHPQTSTLLAGNYTLKHCFLLPGAICLHGWIAQPVLVLRFTDVQKRRNRQISPHIGSIPGVSVHTNETL